MTTPRDPLGEEGKRIVAWLRSESQLAVWRSETCPDDMFTEFSFSAEALSSAADAIERGDHIATTEDKS